MDTDMIDAQLLDLRLRAGSRWVLDTVRSLGIASFALQVDPVGT